MATAQQTQQGFSCFLIVVQDIFLYTQDQDQGVSAMLIGEEAIPLYVKQTLVQHDTSMSRIITVIYEAE